jgi:hypothetical protein
VLLTRPPLAARRQPVRLACIRRAASVRPEPGSNSPDECRSTPRADQTFDVTMTSLPRQAGTDTWNGFGLLCELDWLVSFCVSCLLTTLLLLRYCPLRAVLPIISEITRPCQVDRYRGEATKNRRLKGRREGRNTHPSSQVAGGGLGPLPPLILRLLRFSHRSERNLGAW